MTNAETTRSNDHRQRHPHLETLALAIGTAALAVSLLSPGIATADEVHPTATPPVGIALTVAPTNDEEQQGGHEASDAPHNDQLPQAAATSSPSAQPIPTTPPHDAAEPHAGADTHPVVDSDDVETHGDADAHPATGTDDAETHGDADAHPATGVDDEEAHGVKTPAISPQTKQTVLGAFAGVNGLAIVTAAVLRRRNHPKLPKYLQR